MLGTVAYMSPEQARGSELDARTDLFSLGVVLYEMLTGRQPFTGETASHIIVAILEKEPPPLSQSVGEMPAEVERILVQALAKRPGERYQSAQALQADLARVRKQLEEAGKGASRRRLRRARPRKPRRRPRRATRSRCCPSRT